jgi:AcrR family transcriptional regulator
MPRIRAGSIEQHKALTRSQILMATQELLEVKADISLGEVAAQVGIGRTTMYEYFKDRDDLIAALVESSLPRVIGDILADLPPTDARERMSALVAGTLRFVATDPVLGLILHRELPRLGEQAQNRIRLAHADLIGEVAKVYSHGVDEGVFRPMQVDLAARLIQDSIMSAARVVLNAPDPGRRLESVTTEMQRFLLQGLSVSADLPLR